MRANELGFKALSPKEKHMSTKNVKNRGSHILKLAFAFFGGVCFLKTKQ